MSKMLNAIKMCNYIKKCCNTCYIYLKIFEKKLRMIRKLITLSRKLNALLYLVVLIVIFRRYIKILMFIRTDGFKSRILSI